MDNANYQILHLGKYKFKIRPQPNSDKWIISGVVARNEYKVDAESFKGIGTIIDCGGHVGSFSISNAQYVKRVIAFEPSPESFELFKYNVAVNKINNIEVVNKAVSTETTIKDFFLGEKAGRNTLCDLIYTKPQGVIKTECIGINELFDQYSIENNCLLKMDIEGEEYAVLNKLTKENLNKIKTLVLETHQYPDKDWSYFSIIKLLEDGGLHLDKVVPVLLNRDICAVNLKFIRE